MQENIFISLPINELKGVIIDCVNACLKYHEQPINTKALISDIPDELTITELATYLKCTKSTIHAYKNRGVFPYYQTGRTVFFKKSEVDAALEVGNKKKGVKANG